MLIVLEFREEHEEFNVGYVLIWGRIWRTCSYVLPNK